jgi:hypothetical protein
MFNGHRTNFFAGTAGCACLERVFRDDITNQSLSAVEAGTLRFTFFNFPGIRESER